MINGQWSMGDNSQVIGKLQEMVGEKGKVINLKNHSG
jgi:hypothetical protein